MEAYPWGKRGYGSFRFIFSFETDTQHTSRYSRNNLFIFASSNHKLGSWIIYVKISCKWRREKKICTTFMLEHDWIPVNMVQYFPFYKVRIFVFDCRYLFVFFTFFENFCNKVILVLHHHKTKVSVEVYIWAFLWIYWYWHMKLKFSCPL